MGRHRLLTAALCLVALPALLWADPPKKRPLLFTPAAEGAEEQALADRIDQLIAAEWVKGDVKPADPTSDAEFLRRVSLDVMGRIPRVSDVHTFLDDTDADKRAKLIDKLLSSAQYTNNFTSVWRNLLVPPSNNQFFQNFGSQLDPWLRKRLGDNTPYDQMVRELLTVPVAFPRSGGGGNPNEPSPRVFYQANESKPENLAASTSRLFMGVRLECAQCHDHPFARWTRENFWQYAAFFAGVAPQNPQAGGFSPTMDRAELREIKIPGKEKIVQARFLDGTEPKWKDGVGTRVTLAEWMTSRENPFFAKATVNRLWAHFFGIGIIDPVDEPADDNPPSHPELLDELAKSFVEHGYDLKFLMGAILRTKTYQLSSVMTDPGQANPRTFARMSLKGLTAEQFFDSLALATGFREPDGQRGGFVGGGFGQQTPRAEFLSKFSNYADKRTEFQTSILQALALMNGRFIDDATQPSDAVNLSIMLGGVEEAPFMTTAKKLDALFLATLSRKPTSAELEKLGAYVDEGGPTKNPKKALGDVFWALLNSSEFILNH